MYFNSYEFIFIFLPIALLVSILISSFLNKTLVIAWLALASVVYYGWWKAEYISILVFSIGINYLISQNIERRQKHDLLNTSLLIIGIAFNLGLLGWFKYAGFLALNFNAFVRGDILQFDVLLPIGISFFTFQQIAYLVDIYRNQSKTSSFWKYVLFVSFFPQLIAGPIVHHSEVIPQFSSKRFGILSKENIFTGTIIFSAGLFKKVILADNAAVIADTVFDAAAAGVILTLTEAWLGTLAYTVQIYFDFSGYSDMAIGLACLFGVHLPINFNSPYKATSIIDFWRRWHITLSRFLKHYLYIPLGGNRSGHIRHYFNILVVMLLGGLWHGANWTFVAWGALHGLFIMINHVWRQLIKSRSVKSHRIQKLLRPLSISFTLTAVAFAWVLFRAEDFSVAISMYKSMTGWNSTGSLASLSASTLFTNNLFYYNFFNTGLVLVLYLICFSMPNTQQIVNYQEPGFNRSGIKPSTHTQFTIISPRLILAIKILLFAGFFISIAGMYFNETTEFLYFQF